MKKTLILCCGLSGSGKSYFIEHYLIPRNFHKVVSATTRPMRAGETNGREYYFCGEDDIESMPLATHLWVNEAFWTPGKPKWIYGVPEFELRNNLGKNLVYDVTIYFLPPKNNFDIASKRANMPDDAAVRHANTCDPYDFLDAGLDIDFIAKCSAAETIFSPRLTAFLSQISATR